MTKKELREELQSLLNQEESKRVTLNRELAHINEVNRYLNNQILKLNEEIEKEEEEELLKKQDRL